MLFARLVLLVQALVWGTLGLLYWIRPYEMANLSGMLLMEPASVSDARVFYGGHQFALALFLVFALRRRPLVRPALILVILVQLTLTLSRLLIAWNEGGLEVDAQLAGLIFRGVISVLAIIALYLLDEPDAARPRPLHDEVPDVHELTLEAEPEALPERPRRADFDGL
ncbi:MAG: hypothetical protein GAK43_00957 [Stenotrophomonas maltophilia]|nr:MAG: hypothetical protein GAK43_00957 [Stenotrophomonas maltophilia]